MTSGMEMLLHRAMLDPDATRATAQLKLATKVASSIEREDLVDLLRILAGEDATGKGIEKLADRLRKADSNVTGDPTAYDFALFATAIIRQVLERDDEIGRFATLGVQAISRSVAAPSRHILLLERIVASISPTKPSAPSTPDSGARDAAAAAYNANKANANGIAQHAPPYIDALEKDNAALETALAKSNRLADVAARDGRALAWLALRRATPAPQTTPFISLALDYAYELATIKVSENALQGRVLLELALGDRAHASTTTAAVASAVTMDQETRIREASNASKHADFAKILREISSGGTERPITILDLSIAAYCEFSLLGRSSDLGEGS